MSNGKTPTAGQRTAVGELILLGNERQRLFAEAIRTEVLLREKVVEAFRDHAVPKRVIGQAASINRQTVYRWLTEAGLHEPGLGTNPSEISGGET